MCNLRRNVGNKVVLPDDARPTKYAIHLVPDMVACTFTGSQDISFDVVRETSVIQLHVKDMSISPYVTFTPEGKDKLHSCEVSINTEHTICSIKFASNLPVGKGVLSMEFSGTLNDQMAGFYRSGYTDAQGNKRYMATTQLEAIDARRMFPCVDEPAAKAVFELKITAPADLSVISNMPESRRTLRTGSGGQVLQDVAFMPSPVMSSYLVACCIGQFEFVQSTTKRGTLVRVLSTPGKASLCEFALDVGVRSLEFYEEFFNLPYPLPKLDMIAVPDFAMGAMENWGLVTYREIDLLCDPATVSVARKTRLASVIAHELAHQWFGNLVTMDWWDDLWLNEGFATFMQSYCCDHLFPTWGVWNQYVADDLERALSLDGLRSSHPIQVPIPRAEDVEQVFDAISYCKGASVVRLAFNVLGAEAFREGLRQYMKAFAFSNTVTSDLWDSLQRAADAAGQTVAVAPLMKSWTEQMGYPVLTVSPSGSNFQVAQKWFVADGSHQAEDDAKKWHIPLFVNSSKMSHLMKEKLEIVTCAPGKWLKLNYGQLAPLRVIYDSPELHANLIAGISNGSLPVADRIGLLSDARAFSRSGARQVTELLQLLCAYSSEGDVDVWSALETTIGSLDRVVGTGLGRRKELSEFVISLTRSQLSKLTWDAKPSDDEAQKRLRSILLRLVGSYCSSNDTDVLDEARRRFAVYKDDQGTALLSDDTRTAVLRIVLANPVDGKSEEANWSFLKGVAENPSTSQTAKLNIYSALGSVSSTKLKTQTLNWCLTDAIKTQDFFYPMVSVRTSNDEGAELIWQWLGQNFTHVKARLAKASPSLLASVVQACSSGSITKKRAEEIQAAYGSYPTLTRTVANLVEATNASAAFVERSKGTDACKSDQFWTGLKKQLGH